MATQGLLARSDAVLLHWNTLTDMAGKKKKPQTFSIFRDLGYMDNYPTSHKCTNRD